MGIKKKRLRIAARQAALAAKARSNQIKEAAEKAVEKIAEVATEVKE